jgi:Putative auto-transporter adhesin, head GIN domain
VVSNHILQRAPSQTPALLHHQFTTVLMYYKMIRNMKNVFLVSILFMVSIAIAMGQKNTQINGNGKLVTVNTPTIATNISNIKIDGIPGGNGAIEINVGATEASINIQSDENLVQYFDVQQKGKNLIVAMPKNRNNKLWIENTHIRIVIAVPQLEKLDIEANLNCTVSGLNNTRFELQKSSNGDIQLKGMVQDLQIDKTGNGNIEAKDMVAIDAKINSMGNGDVKVTVNNLLKTNRSGNGSIINYGTASAKKGLDMGNGATIDPASRETADSLDNTPVTYVTVNLVNPNVKKMHLSVYGDANKKFSYGFDINGLSSREERLPVGTKVKNKLGKVLYTVVAEDEGQSIQL